MAETAETFDRYWNSASVFGVEQIIRGKGNLSAFLTQATATENSDRARKLAVQLETSAVRFRDGAVQPEFTGWSWWPTIRRKGWARLRAIV